MNRIPETVYILGAGFSKCAGLPIQSEFSKMLLSDIFASPIDVEITNNIRLFLGEVFSWNDSAQIPSMEDIFTCIDLSAGSGHHLGVQFGPKQLRAIRRMLIYRIFQILNQEYRASEDIAQLLRLNPGEAGFVVLNWDVVLERHWENIGYCDGTQGIGIDYGTEYTSWTDVPRPSRLIRVAKVHGSSNWVYCDNCRVLFVDPFSKLSLEVRAGLLDDDFRLFRRRETRDSLGLGDLSHAECPKCRCQVGPHIATFSFKKSFRSYAFLNSWQYAEKLLTAASRWVFVGYSMPAADFEFKHMMKACELRSPRKDIEAVVLNDQEAKDRFERFFGARVTVDTGGLSGFLKGG